MQTSIPCAPGDSEKRMHDLDLWSLMKPIMQGVRLIPWLKLPYLCLDLIFWLLT